MAVVYVGATEMAGKIFSGGDEPAETSRIENMKQYLIAVYSEDSLSDTTTPQFETLLRMALEDTTGLFSEAAVQRYIMGILYFTTGGNRKKPKPPHFWNTCKYHSFL